MEKAYTPSLGLNETKIEDVGEYRVEVGFDALASAGTPGSIYAPIIRIGGRRAWIGMDDWSRWKSFDFAIEMARKYWNAEKTNIIHHAIQTGKIEVGRDLERIPEGAE
jgi:hypothetical protein